MGEEEEQFPTGEERGVYKEELKKVPKSLEDDMIEKDDEDK